MQTSPGAPYSANTPPFVLNTEMSGQSYSGVDFEFFDASSFLSDHDGTSANPHLGSFAPADYSNSLIVGPEVGTEKALTLDQTAFVPKTATSQIDSAQSISSPSGSYHDSGSDSSKRKFSSESSHSSPLEAKLENDTDMSGTWNMHSLPTSEDFENAFISHNDGTMNPAYLSMSAESIDHIGGLPQREGSTPSAKLSQEYIVDESSKFIHTKESQAKNLGVSISPSSIQGYPHSTTVC